MDRTCEKWNDGAAEERRKEGVEGRFLVDKRQEIVEQMFILCYVTADDDGVCGKEFARNEWMPVLLIIWQFIAGLSCD